MMYGRSKLEGKFVLGPMAAYTDIAFRLLCRKNGAAMAFTEFSNANAIVLGSKKSWQLLQTCREEMPVGIQIFGSDEKMMAGAAKEISSKVLEGQLHASCIDLNFGCPAGSVVNAGAGAALLKNPKKIFSIVSSCVKASEIPITAKIRAGWGSDMAVEIAKAIENAGASGITVHWRTATEGRRRSDGWMAVAKVKQEVNIPVIGNGGATTPQKAVRFLEEAGCDAVMISSGALGNPRIFEDANLVLEGKEPKEHSLEEKISDFKEYFLLCRKYGILSKKRLVAHAMEFLKGFSGAKKAREELMKARMEEEVLRIVEDFASKSP